MMDNNRSKILIGNLLNEIADKVWEAPAEQFEPWLIEEVGFTREEIEELKADGLFHEPSDFTREER